MNVTIIAVGKLKESYLRDGAMEYTKRLTPYARVNIVEVSEERLGDSPSPAEVEAALNAEGERIISKIPKGSFVIPMCIEGEELSSPNFAKKIEKISLTNSSITFIIGSSFGLSQQVKAKANFKFSLGKLTLPHQLARLVLLEQIYRAFSILNNSKYHK